MNFFLNKIHKMNNNIETEFIFECDRYQKIKSDDNFISGSWICLKCSSYKNICYICGSSASFNNIGETTGISCKKHKTDGMIDIKHKQCEKCGIKQPHFNKEGETVAKYCGDCKTDGMIDIKHKKCVKCGIKQPNFI
jgi:hypothetical protein